MYYYTVVFNKEHTYSYASLQIFIKTYTKAAYCLSPIESGKYFNLFIQTFKLANYFKTQTEENIQFTNFTLSLITQRFNTLLTMKGKSY